MRNLIVDILCVLARGYLLALVLILCGIAYVVDR